MSRTAIGEVVIEELDLKSLSDEDVTAITDLSNTVRAEARPNVKDIRTGNADSNDAMLAINRQLGFTPYIAASAWQAPVRHCAHT